MVLILHGVQKANMATLKDFIVSRAKTFIKSNWYESSRAPETPFSRIKLGNLAGSHTLLPQLAALSRNDFHQIVRESFEPHVADSLGPNDQTLESHGINSRHEQVHLYNKQNNWNFAWFQLVNYFVCME